MPDPFYGSREWFKIRSKALKRDGWLCRMCGKNVKPKYQAHVDHVISRRKRPDLSLVLDNLQTLCSHCHNSNKKRDENNPNRGCNEQGLPNDGSWD